MGERETYALGRPFAPSPFLPLYPSKLRVLLSEVDQLIYLREGQAGYGIGAPKHARELALERNDRAVEDAVRVRIKVARDDRILALTPNHSKMPAGLSSQGIPGNPPLMMS